MTKMDKLFRAIRSIALQESRSFSTFHLTRRNAQSYWHEPGREPLQYVTLAQLLERSAKQYGDREAIVSAYEGKRLTYRELLEQADKVAAGYRSLGLTPGDRIAIWGPNSWRWIVCRLAAARAGLIPVDMNPRYCEREVEHCLRISGASAVVAAEGFRGLVYHDILTASAPPELKTIVTLADKTLPGAVRYSDLVSAGSSEDLRSIQQSQGDVSPDSICNILFSSGTTGDPKAVALKHVGVVNSSYCIGKRISLQDKPHRLGLLLPIFSVAGSVVGMTNALHFGATIVIPSEVHDPRTVVDVIRAEKCSFLIGAPTLYLDLLKVVEEDGHPLDTVDIAITGGAYLSPEVYHKTTNKLGIKRMCGVYGLSEASAIVFQMKQGDSTEVMAHTVGKVSDHTEVKVVDKEGRPVPFGTPGELCVRGYSVMKEYYRNEEATKRTLVDGWLKTGDQFVLQEDGYGRIVGRLKDLVIRGGENIYPAEIEDILATHPDVFQAQVVGVPDDRMGEEVCACLLLRSGTQLSARQVRQFCLGKMANSKIPRYTAIMSEFPVVPAGKVPKHKLKEQCEALMKNNELDDSRAPASADGVTTH